MRLQKIIFTTAFIITLFHVSAMNAQIVTNPFSSEITIGEKSAQGISLLDSANTWNHLNASSLEASRTDTATKYRIGLEPVVLGGEYGDSNYYNLEIVKALPEELSWQSSSVFLREEDSKIYYAIPNAESESFYDPHLKSELTDNSGVLYDFSLSVNDTFKKPAILFGDIKDQKLVVRTIDTVQLENGEEHRRWLFSLITSQGNTPWGAWIEGIGDTGGLLAPGAIGVLDAGAPILLCFSQNEQVLYSRGDRCDRTTSLNRQDTKSINQLKLYPNPSSGYIYLDDYDRYQRIDILDFSGRIILSSKEKNSRVDLQHLPKGTYLVKAISNDGGVRIAKLILSR